jgi:dienelactone hydrolase
MIGIRFPVIRVARVLAACLLLGACTFSPFSRTSADSLKDVSLFGCASAAKQGFSVQAADQNFFHGRDTLNGSLPPLQSESSATGTSVPGISGTCYQWKFDAGVLPANNWSPQMIVSDLATSQGELQISPYVAGPTPMKTFSQGAALGCSSRDITQCSDGNATVLFDPNGVGSGPEGQWQPVTGTTWKQPSPNPNHYSDVIWSLGTYTVENGGVNGPKTIYGLICSPTTGGPHPVVIYNHGGVIGISATVNQDGSGGADDLGRCADWAKRGWVFAESVYRGECFSVTSNNHDVNPGIVCSDPKPVSGDILTGVELCLGEVTDAMALTDLVVKQPYPITVGSTKLSVDPNRVFMYGYSHGGCVTYRAVEQGAPVTAFSVIEGFTDFRLNYLMALLANRGPGVAAVWSGAYQPPAPPTLSGSPTPESCFDKAAKNQQEVSCYYLPDTNGVMGYNWRSAHYFAQPPTTDIGYPGGDLSIQKFKTMPILILHGDIDLHYLTDSTGNPLPPNPIAGDGDANWQPNPVPLPQPAAIAPDITTTNIFVGPPDKQFHPCTPHYLNCSEPSSVACLLDHGEVGKPLIDQFTKQTQKLELCPITFNSVVNDPCADGPVPQLPALPWPQPCQAVMLTPPPGQPPHYLVVFHNMDHFNFSPAIAATLNSFVQQKFGIPTGFP